MTKDDIFPTLGKLPLRTKENPFVIFSILLESDEEPCGIIVHDKNGNYNDLVRDNPFFLNSKITPGDIYLAIKYVGMSILHENTFILDTDAPTWLIRAPKKWEYILGIYNKFNDN